MLIVQIFVAQSTDKAFPCWNEPILDLKSASFDILRELHKISTCPHMGGNVLISYYLSYYIT